MGTAVRVGLSRLCLQEEESPCGEVTLKRDRSFSEHDLVQLRNEVASGLQPATHPLGGLEPPRARAGSMNSCKPSPQEQGKCCLSPPPPPLCPEGTVSPGLAPCLPEQAAPGGYRELIWQEGCLTFKPRWPSLSQAGTPHFFLT